MGVGIGAILAGTVFLLIAYGKGGATTEFVARWKPVLRIVGPVFVVSGMVVFAVTFEPVAMGFPISMAFVFSAIIRLVVSAFQTRTHLRVRETYYKTLEELKQAPENRELREATLASGQAYARHVRRFANLTPGRFTEEALAYDMNLACNPPRICIGTTNATAEERLRELSALHGEKGISDGEYQSRRQQILDEI